VTGEKKKNRRGDGARGTLAAGVPCKRLPTQAQRGGGWKIVEREFQTDRGKEVVEMRDGVGNVLQKGRGARWPRRGGKTLLCIL